MFPNMRLLIGALLASVVVLCGGFTVFAAFRVSHEPLSRLPADTVALQLVANETAGPPPAWQAASAFGVDQSVAKARTDRAITDAPRPLPVSRVTIRPSDLTAISTLTPAAMIDAPQATMPPPHTSPSPVSFPAAAGAAAPTAPNAVARAQAAPPTPINNGPAAVPSAAANNKTAAAEQTSAAQTKPAQSAPDIKLDAAGKAGEAAAAPMPRVAAIEPASDPNSPGARTEAANTLPEAAVPEPKPRPKLLGKAAWRALREAALRRRIATRERTAAGVPGSSVAQSGYQNSAFGNPFFQSAPGAFARQPGRNRATLSNRAKPAHNSIAGNQVNWSSSQ